MAASGTLTEVCSLASLSFCFWTFGRFSRWLGVFIQEQRGEKKKKHVARGRWDLSNYWHAGKNWPMPLHTSQDIWGKKTENLSDNNKGKRSNRCMLRIPAFAAWAQVNTSHDGETFLYFRALTLLLVQLRASWWVHKLQFQPPNLC